MKLTRRIAVAGACAAIAGGALLAGGSPALAAAPRAAGHLPVHGTAGGSRHHTAQQPTDPWIADQLATFYPPSTQRAAVFDPWVKDQLALFPPASQ
ncbi:hypothetical protein ACF1BE_13765 [Streptomyces sp. NPDC014991]|uniref:hypothetical protein n=1 Tax=Streptomyces sp. NPDC014991 TaxID=3364935 RepID=UPI0036FA42B8